MLVYGECECFVMQILYVCVLCASSGGILQSRSHNGFIGSHECLLLFTPSCCSECFYDL